MTKYEASKGFITLNCIVSGKHFNPFFF